MSDQGTTPPHGTPPVDEPTQAVPPSGAGGAGPASVFGDEPSEGADPTVAVPAAAAAGASITPSGGAGGSGGSGGPDDPGAAEGGDRPWYAHPAAIAAAALLGIGAIVVILVLALGGDDDPEPTIATGVPTTSTTSTTSTTAVATTESRCRGGDQAACDEFSDAQLEIFCNEGVAAACQVLLARQGDGVPDDTAPLPAPSDADLCRGGDAPACSRLSDEDVSEICGERVTVACDEQDRRFDDEQYAGFVEQCRNGIDAGCQLLRNEDLAVLCDEGNGAACAELDSRTGE